MTKWFKSFYERRIAVPVDRHGLMLDVGCGDKPHWRADVLVDKFVDAEHAKQRNLGGEVAAVEPLFVSSLEDLPFCDDAFDFVYCSHVLEHVVDPASAISEIMRVGKRGYIEVPFVGIQKIYDQETHVWFCDLRDRTLIFTAKESATFDNDIERFLRKGPVRPFAFIMNFFPDAAMIRVHWSRENPITIRVLGAPNLKLTEPVEDSPDAAASPSRWMKFRNVLRFCFSSKLRREPIQFNHIVKPEYRRDFEEVLSHRVYRLSGAIEN
jgi:SAM-dependent methyltransferase